MPSAIRVLDEKNLTIGLALLGLHGDRQGSVKEQVHDGDTIIVRPAGNIGVRMLGIDTPEVSFRLPGDNRFRSISERAWEEFLADPFSDRWPPFDPPLPAELREHLRSRVGPGTAENHHRHARAAEDALESMIADDMQTMGRTTEDFQFFLAFAFEVMDGYGRFLCFINRDQPDPQQPAPRPRSYNERMLRNGRACPYFIWPNINPWRKADSISAAVLEPGTARDIAAEDSSLEETRQAVQAARSRHAGIFDAIDPLRLEPFELRLVARRAVPSRWVIDLGRNDDVLLPPHAYHTIPNPEDRLFIPSEYVPLFVERGWKRSATP